MREIQAILMATFLFFPSFLWAHGVRGDIGSGGVVVTAEYDTTEPMSYAKVEVSAPETKLPFQSGRTDRNGRFVFFPDTPGIWKIVIDDEIGHRLEMEIPIDTAMEIDAGPKAGNSVGNYLPKYALALMGVCVIFGIFGCLTWYKGRQYYRKGLK